MLHRSMLIGSLLVCSAAALASGGPLPSAGHPVPGRPGPRLDVLVDGVTRPQYVNAGTRYIEAVRGREYQIRLTNPFPVRVAVALAVDGLNTIDARHTTAADARKWVLDPYETITLSGWQVSRSQARRFHFTTESRSYGQALGQTENLGVISAVFFRERRVFEPQMAAREQSAPSDRQPAEAKAGAAAGAPSPSAARTSDEYAATGIGRRTEHQVQEVSIDLDPVPAASVRIRYEFREQLVKLGVLPDADPLARRERGSGFEPGFCPEPKR